jgi:hypothetical protein
MDEETKPEQAPIPTAPMDLVEKANAAAARIEAANKALSELLDRQERLSVAKALGGKTEAGTIPPTEEDKELEDAKKWLAGTGFEDVILPKPRGLGL